MIEVDQHPWVGTVSREFDIPSSRRYIGRSTENPLNDGLSSLQVGTFYELDPNILATHLNPTFHDPGLGNSLRLDQVLHKTLRTLNTGCHKAAMVGTGLTGFITAGYDLLEDDGGHRGTHNNPENDLDLIIATQRVEHDRVIAASKYATEFIRILSSTPGNRHYFHWAKLDPLEWHTSSWQGGMGSAKLNFRRPDYRANNRWSSPFTAAEFGHVDSGSLKESMIGTLGQYNPFYSNIIGIPTFLISPEGKHYIWQPIDVNLNAPVHEINLYSPHDFANSPRSMKQIVHGAHFCVLAQAAAKYIAPTKIAVPSQKMIEIFQEVVQKWSGEISEKQKEHLVNRLETSVFRAQVLENRHQASYLTEQHAFDNHPGTVELMTDVLDKIGWGKAVLGISVKKYIENNPVN